MVVVVVGGSVKAGRPAAKACERPDRAADWLERLRVSYLSARTLINPCRCAETPLVQPEVSAASGSIHRLMDGVDLRRPQITSRAGLRDQSGARVPKMARQNERESRLLIKANCPPIQSGRLEMRFRWLDKRRHQVGALGELSPRLL